MLYHDKIKIIFRSCGSSKKVQVGTGQEKREHSNREDGPYCTMSGNEPSSVTLYKTGSKSQTFLLQFQEFTSLNQRHIFPKGPNNIIKIVKKMILNVQYI